MSLKSILRNWIIPPGFYRIKNRLGNISNDNSSSIKSKHPTLKVIPESFRDKYAGKRCFILATGPSIKNQDLKVLEGELCIAVSMFHLHPDIELINPIWHVLAPPHPPFKFDAVDKIFSTAVKSYQNSNEVNFLLGTTDYEFSYYNYLNAKEGEFLKVFREHIYFADYRKAKLLTEQNFSDENIWDIRESPFVIRTVIYSAIQLAYFLGFKEIVLLGCDHDYLLDFNRVEDHHFYDEQKGFSDKEHLHSFSKEKWFLEYYSRWRDYRLMRDFLDSQGVNVINASKKTMLDVFPLKEFESLFSYK